MLNDVKLKMTYTVVLRRWISRKIGIELTFRPWIMTAEIQL